MHEQNKPYAFDREKRAHIHILKKHIINSSNSIVCTRAIEFFVQIQNYAIYRTYTFFWSFYFYILCLLLFLPLHYKKCIHENRLISFCGSFFYTVRSISLLLSLSLSLSPFLLLCRFVFNLTFNNNKRPKIFECEYTSAVHRYVYAVHSYPRLHFS